MFRALKSSRDDIYARMEESAGEEYERVKVSTVLRYDASDGRLTQKNQGWEQPKMWIGHNLEQESVAVSSGHRLPRHKVVM